MQRLLLLSWLFILPTLTIAQRKSSTTPNNSPAPLPITVPHVTRHGEAKRIDAPPKIDALLTDEAWQIAEPFSQFTQFSPTPGAASHFKTEVKVTYDNRNIYVAALLRDSFPKKIQKELTLRDVIGNDDYFAVYFDTFNDHQNAFVFGVTAAGVQADARLTNGTEDYAWNVVWKSAVKQTKEGWVVEMEIPYSALRFPERLRQQWNVNFRREVRRVREVSYWNPIDPNIDGMVQQFGNIDSVSYIRPAARLSFTPYLVTTSRYLPTSNPNEDPWKHQLGGGIDMKLGLGESHTLDMSIIPDFGQVQSDDVVLNLSPYEVRFDENRPFFTENTDIFNRGNLFYSRRIGGKPYNYDAAYRNLDSTKTVTYNPERSSISNILKISGRDKNGLGIGFLNAIQGGTFADISRGKGLRETVQTDPRTNFNLLVVEKLLPNNSYISFTNASTIREGLYRDANVTAADFRMADKANAFAFAARGAISNIFKNDTARSISRGYSYGVSLAKVSGKTRFEIGRSLDGDTYDPTDMGFLLTNNLVRNYAGVRQVVFQPRGAINNFQAYANTQYVQLFKPNVYTRWDVNIGTTMQLKNFWELGLNVNFVPKGIDDYFEARKTHQKFAKPTETEISGRIASDNRKKLSFVVSGGYNAATDTSTRRSWYVTLSPYIRLNNRFSLIPSVTASAAINEQGFADTLYGSEIFGTRNRQQIATTLMVNYLFSAKSSFSVRARHYWSVVNYGQYHALQDDGKLRPIANPFKTPDLEPNRNYNIFNIDLVYRWQFAPGSELDLIWKNSVLTDTKAIVYDYGENFDNVFAQSHNNLVSVKFLYYLDYLKIRKKKR